MPFPESPRVTFGKNPLAEVICQLQFPPILDISYTDPAAFQNRIRDKYPEYQKQIELQVPAPIAEILSKFPLPLTPENLAHKFSDDTTGRSIILTRQQLSLIERNYSNWENFGREFINARHALQDIYHPAYYSKIGLRYVNKIDRFKLGISDEPWQALIKPTILGMIGVADIADYVLEFQNVAVLSLDDVENGRVRIFHGLVKDVGKRDSQDNFMYVFDADFYLEKKWEATMLMRSLGSSIAMQGTSSGGQSPSDLITHLNLVQASLSTQVTMAPDELNALFVLNPFDESGRVSISYSIPNSPELSEQALQRFLCHYAVAFMPESGVSEMFESLATMWQFYSAPAPAIPIRNSPQLGTGIIVERRERPPLVLEDQQ